MARHTCFLTFDALTNDSSIREILRTSKVDEFEHFTEVVQICMSLALTKEMRIFKTSESDPAKDSTQAK